LAELGLPLPVESLELRPGASHARPDSGLWVLPQITGKCLDGMRKHAAGYFGQNERGASNCGRDRRDNFPKGLYENC
jgi:hypothetical protein